MNALARWGGIFDIDAKIIEITNEEEKTFAPDFWNKAKDAEIIVKNLRSKKKWVDDYNIDILGVQETKSQKDQIPNTIFNKEFSFKTASQSKIKGRSGTALFSDINTTFDCTCPSVDILD